MNRRDHAAGEPRGTVLALHGFTRSPRHLQGLTDSCTALGFDVVRPALSAFWWPRSANNSRYLSDLADELVSDLTGTVVVVGHSAGASAGSWIAARLIQSGVVVHTGLEVRGLVFLDGVDGPGRFIARSWPVISQVPIRAVLAPPSSCNRHGRLEKWLADAGVDSTVVAGSGHGDIEDGDPLVYRVVCGRRSTPDAHRRFLAASLEAINQVMDWAS